MKTLRLKSARSPQETALLWALERNSARQARKLKFAPKQPFRPPVERVEKRQRTVQETVFLLALQRSMIVNNIADLQRRSQGGCPPAPPRFLYSPQVRPIYERPEIPDEFATEIPLLLNQGRSLSLDAEPVNDLAPYEKIASPSLTPLEILMALEDLELHEATH